MIFCRSLCEENNSGNNGVVGEVVNHLVKAESPPEIFFIRFPSVEIFFSGFDSVHKKMDNKVKKKTGKCKIKGGSKHKDDNESNDCMCSRMQSKRREKTPIIFELTEHVRCLKRVIRDKMLQLK